MIVLDIKEFQKLGGLTAMIVKDLQSQNSQIVPQITDGIRDISESLEGRIGEYRKDSRRDRKRARRMARKIGRMKLRDIFLGGEEKIASIEINGPVENKDFKTRLKSGTIGALNYFPGFAGMGAIAPILASIVTRGKMKSSMEKSLQDAFIMGGTGAVLGGARGFLFPEGRKILKVEDGKFKFIKLDPGQ